MSHDCKGCREYHQVSRRQFLSWTAAAATVAAVPSWLPRVVLADSESSSRDVLVSIFLRGGADGLSVCVPHGDAAYYALRPTIAIRRPGQGPNAARDLDGFFGLPPALAPLLEAYQNGDLLMVHATGLTDGTRSHFNAMYFTEVGQPAPPASLFTGWIGRHLQTSAPTVAGGALRAVGLGYGLQRSLVGGPLAVPVRDLGDVGFAGVGDTLAERREALRAMWSAAPDPGKTAALGTLRTVDLLNQIDFGGYQPAGGADYPDDEFGYALKSTAALLKADVGVEVAALDYGGWDTHEEEGPVDGAMAELLSSLGRGLAAFHRDLWTSGRTNVVVVVQSEFGRNAFENASRGTDHGHGNAMLVLGGSVAGGRVLADWPGLAQGQLYEEQDLAITIDYRDVLAEIVRKRLGNANLRAVFPDPRYTPVERGVIG
jgi:uncharacterized protein (DUF1501 family)